MSDPKEALSAINRCLPNVATYIKVILKRERLSEEAESYRARYEAVLRAMEEGHPPPRPISFIGDDDSGYHSTKPKGGFLPDQMPSVHQTSFLLRRDDKYRWHRYWCKANSRDMKFSIFADSNEENLLKRLPLETVTSLFGPPQANECDKENCFILSGILDGGSEGESGTSEEIYLAAYSEADYHQWRSALSLLTGSRESVRMSSASFLDGAQWGVLPTGHDSASTSSSNFSSNRESMISTVSSLPYGLRLPGHDSPPRGKSPLEQGVSAGDVHMLPNKQQQPLPSPPPAQDAEEEDNNDNDSVGTIYENIDNLVMQFDSTMQATVQAMGQVGQQLKSNKKRKKKERSLLRQPSFFKGSKGHKSKLSMQKKTELEKGERYSGYLFKKSTSGSWKKKWCVLRGAVLSYYKTQEDTEGREYVVLDAQVERLKDPKKSYAFTVQLRGVPEPLFFGSDEESIVNEWIVRLENASKSKGDFDWDQLHEESGIEDVPPQYQSQTSLDSVGVSDGHYNIPRTLMGTEQASQAPAIHILSAEEAINSGIYSIPRSLPVLDSSTFSIQGQSFILSGDPFAQYDVPRPVSLTPDEEAIYDYPENVVDMEIYDYPPDAIPLLPEDVSRTSTDSVRNSVVTLTSEYAPSERASGAIPEDWSHLPPPPASFSSSRPSMAISTASSDEYYQSARNSVASMEGLYDHPRSHASEALISGVLEKAPEIPTTESTDSPESSLEFGICVMKGHLYKRERFTWNKMFCLIRNSFLECHKPGSVQGPTLKLFLPRSTVSPDSEVKRHWAFKVKHPRREGLLQFAAENEEEYKKWMKAFHSAASIEVQSVNTVEEIRITDLDMQRRWTSMERDANTLQLPESAEAKQAKLVASGAGGRRNTYSAGDEYMTDTMKRRKKFAWIKSLSKKRGMPHPAVSLTQLERDSRLVSSEGQQFMNGVHKPQSMDLGPLGPSSPAAPTPESRSCRIVTEEGIERFQGYLKVQRKGADNMWVRYWCTLEELVVSCYISKSDLTLTLSIQLKGSRIAEAISECKREFSFKIWHLESGQCLYFAADDAVEFKNWFTEVTKGAEYVVPLDAGISNSPLSAPFYHYTKEGADTSPSQRSSRSSNASLPSPIDIDNASLDSCTTGQPGSSNGSINHRGNLKKLAQNKWKDRYCLIKDSTLYVYANSGEKSPLTSVSLLGCKVELVNVPHEEVHHNTFRISTTSGKTHMFSTSSEQEMYAWAMALQDCSHVKPRPDEIQKAEEDNSLASNVHGKGNKKQSKYKSKEADLVSNIPANKLTDPAYSGYAEVQSSSGAWTRYWCVAHMECLYVYQNQDSDTAVRTISLPGCEVRVGGPHGCKKSCVLTLYQPGVSLVYVAVTDQMELTKWFQALEMGTKLETVKLHRPAEDQRVQQEEVMVLTHKPSSRSSLGVKGPMKADHSIGTQVPKAKEDKETTKPHTTEDDDLRAQQNAVVRRYEKKIRKTHRVANLTEQNLKQQQSSLLHFKRELSRLTVKLQEMASAGDRHAEKRLKDVRVKLQQTEKIIPYIGKYIMVNRQAEIQTVAILKETCTVDLQTLKGKSEDGGPVLTSQQRLSGISVSSVDSRESPERASLPLINAQLETHFEEAESTPGTEPPTPLAVSAESLSRTLQQSLLANTSLDAFQSQPQAASQVSNSAALITGSTEPPHPHNVSGALTPTVVAAQTSSDPPYVNLTTIRAEVVQIKESLQQGTEQDTNSVVKQESPYATLASVRPPNVESGNQKGEEVHYAELKQSASPVSPGKSPPTNYAELDFSKMNQVAPTSPKSRLNYVQVDFNPTKQKPVLNETAPQSTDVYVGKTKGNTTTAEPSDKVNEEPISSESVDGSGSMLETTLTPESALQNIETPPVSPIKAASSLAPKSKASARQDAIKLFETPSSSTPISSTKTAPPPVRRKPSVRAQVASTAQPISQVSESTPSPSHSSRDSSERDCAKVNEDLTGSESPSHVALRPTSGEHVLEAHSVTAGTMSVMERIKALQKKNAQENC